jgi:hypothetical protein
MHAYLYDHCRRLIASVLRSAFSRQLIFLNQIVVQGWQIAGFLIILPNLLLLLKAGG